MIRDKSTAEYPSINGCFFDQTITLNKDVVDPRAFVDLLPAMISLHFRFIGMNHPIGIDKATLRHLLDRLGLLMVIKISSDDAGELFGALMDAF